MVRHALRQKFHPCGEVLHIVPWSFYIYSEKGFACRTGSAEFGRGHGWLDLREQWRIQGGFIGFHGTPLL